MTATGPDPGCGCAGDSAASPPRRRLSIALPVVAGLAVVGAAAAAVLGAAARPVAVLLALGALCTGGTLVTWAHRLAPGEPDEEPRQQEGPRLGRRRLIIGAGAGAAALTAAAVAFPALRRTSSAARELRETPWRAGVRAVDERGQLVRLPEIALGSIVTAFPEGATHAIDAQAVFIRVEPERLVADPERLDWAVEGLVAYSKLCTHMACPLGLFQQESGTLLCPCHQAVFDVLDGGRAVQGPARRALPQLPLSVDADGVVVARGGFSEAPGAGYWERPS